MSADLLREAAAKMRERAEAATPSPWFALAPSAVFNPSVATRTGTVDDLESREWVAEASPNRDEGRGGSDAEHIASWHPAVALAVADWLDSEADASDWNKSLRAVATRTFRAQSSHAVTVARAYLGRDA